MMVSYLVLPFLNLAHSLDITIFFTDGKVHGVGLDFVEFSSHHTGKNIAKAFMGVVDQYRLRNKIVGIVMDNASSNDIAIKEIAVKLGLDNTTFPTADELHFRCFGHVMNLGCKGEY
jgi:hypothetical protein